MKPPMRNEVMVGNPVLDSSGKPIINDYGKPKMLFVSSKARVSKKTKTVRATDGELHETFLEVDLPTETTVTKGANISYTDNQGQITKGQVIAVDEISNLAGTKVYYRTINVG